MTKKENAELKNSQGKERRSFLEKTAGLIAGVGVASAIASPAIARNRRKLKMVMTWPKKFPGLGTGAERIAKGISSATDGRINIKLYGAGELVPAFESFDAVSNGTADLYHGAAYYWQGKEKAANFFTTVPFGMTANGNNAWIKWGGGQELWDELYAGYNLKPLLAGNTGVQMGGWFRKEINSINDLKGLKMRMPGLGGAVLNKLGASAVSLPGGEIFQALQTGNIDATEWVGPYNDLAMGFYKVAPYYYYPGFHEPGSMFECVFNTKVWDSFSKSDRTLITAICEAENSNMFAEYNAKNSASLKTLVDKHNVKLRKFSDEIYTSFYNASQEVIEEVMASDPKAEKVGRSYQAFSKEFAEWNNAGEIAYTSMVNKMSK